MADKTVTVKPSGGTYTTLAAAITGEVTANANLVTMDGILTISIEGDWSGGADTTAVIINGFTMDATRYLRIVADSANRAIKTGYSTSRYRLEVTSGTALLNQDKLAVIEGLQIKVTASSGAVVGVNPANAGNTASGDELRIRGCRIVGVLTGTATGSGVLLNENSGGYGNVQIYNSIISGWTTGIKGTYCQTVKVFNSIVYGCGTGVTQDSNTYAVLTATNCAVFSHTDDFVLQASSTVDHCASDDNDGTNNVAESGGGAAWPSDFTDSANGDFTLIGTSGLVGTGVDNPGAGLYSDDIDYVARSSVWDVGADEYVAAGGGGSVVSAYQVYYDRMRRVQ
jgi:hypothetical protein